jgi:hypothetical protein
MLSLGSAFVNCLRSHFADTDLLFLMSTINREGTRSIRKAKCDYFRTTDAEEVESSHMRYSVMTHCIVNHNTTGRLVFALVCTQLPSVLQFITPPATLVCFLCDESPSATHRELSAGGSRPRSCVMSGMSFTQFCRIFQDGEEIFMMNNKAFGRVR